MLELKQVSVNYGSVQALKKVDIVVNENEIVALIGNNGAGKSTTLRVISGQVRPFEGTVQFNGSELTKVPVHKIAEMGIAHVPEGRKVFYKLSVKENLMMGAYTRNDRQGIKDSLAMVLDTFPILKTRYLQQGGTLSGGEQQMLAVGRAMMAHPKILLLDEPSLGLAPLVVQVVAENIMRIAATGIPILLVEQNAGLALELSNRAYVLDTGRLEMSGLSKDLAKDDAVRRAYLGIG